MPVDDIDKRVNKLEHEHGLLSQELSQINKTLSKIEVSIEKQNEISSELRALRAEFQAHLNNALDSAKRQNKRIEDLEKDQSKVVWLIISAVIATLMEHLLIK